MTENNNLLAAAIGALAAKAPKVAEKDDQVTKLIDLQQKVLNELVVVRWCLLILVISLGLFVGLILLGTTTSRSVTF
jgi:hypothetical protein